MEYNEDEGIVLETLEQQLREEFQIPPYFPKEAMIRFFKEGRALFERLNPAADLESDHVFQSLLKNYVNYAYRHRVAEFKENYRQDILQWQLTTPVE